MLDCFLVFVFWFFLANLITNIHTQIYTLLKKIFLDVNMSQSMCVNFKADGPKCKPSELLKGKVSCVNHNKLHLPLHTWRWDAATAHTRVSTITRRSSTLSAQTLITVQVLCFARESLIIFIFNPRHSDC